MRRTPPTLTSEDVGMFLITESYWSQPTTINEPYYCILDTRELMNRLEAYFLPMNYLDTNLQVRYITAKGLVEFDERSLRILFTQETKRFLPEPPKLRRIQ